MELWQLFLYTLSAWMFLSLLVMGFGFILRSVKFFNVAYGGAFLVGGYMMFLFYNTLTISFIPAMLLSLLASGLYLAFAYKLIFSPLLHRRASNFVLLITSFGLLTATSAIIGMIFGNQTTIIAHNLSDIYTIGVLGARLNIVQATTIIFVPIIIFIFAYIRSKTRFGRATRAVEDDSEVAELVGVPKEKIFLQLFFIGGILAGLGGIAEGFDLGILPTAGMLYILPIVVISVVGGIKSFWGGILGAFIMVVAQKLTVVFFGGSWEQAVPFIILIIILLVRPEGMLKR